MISTSTFGADQVQLADLIGVYKIHSTSQVSSINTGVTVEYRLGISSKTDSLGDHIIGLNEIYKQKLDNGTEILLGELKCAGTASLGADFVMNTSVRCENDSSFDQRLTFKDLSQIKGRAFAGSVFSSVSGKEVEMVFERYN